MLIGRKRVVLVEAGVALCRCWWVEAARRRPVLALGRIAEEGEEPCIVT